MNKKNDNMTNDKSKNSIKDINTIQNEINNEMLAEKKKKAKSDNPYFLFISFVIKHLKEDKLYLISFVITLSFIVIFSFFKVQEAEGFYEKNKEKTSNDSNIVSTVDTNFKEDTNIKLDVSDYVGIYSREVMLASPLVLTDSCTITSYKLVYQVKKDKSIIKYFVNDCVGNIKIWSGELAYVSNGGARYISANDVNYLFSANNMKEVEGDTYHIDDDISTIKEKNKIIDYKLYFLGSNIIFMNDSNLISVKGNDIDFQLSDKYINNGGSLEKRVYKSSIKNQFNFIVFENGEKTNCYDSTVTNSAEFVDGVNYKVYSIKYNTEKDSFNTPKEVVSRNKSEGCRIYDEDLENLKE